MDFKTVPQKLFVQVDAYIEFISQYNGFINHQPKPFQRINDHIMKLGSSDILVGK